MKERMASVREKEIKEQETEKASGNAEAHVTESGREKRKRKAQLMKTVKSRALLILYTLVIAAVLVTAVIFSIYTFFKVNNVVIEGTNYYTNEEIMEVAGIKIGDSLLFADTQTAERKLEEELLYIENVSLNKKIPSTLSIKITQAVPIYSVSYHGKYLYVSAEGKILEVSSQVMAGSMVVEGGEVLESNGILSFKDEKVNDAFIVLTRAIKETGTAGIDYIDISNIFNINARYDGRVNLKFGSAQDLGYKMKFAVNIINSENGIGETERGTLDLSLARETNKSYFSPEIYSQNEGGGTIELSPSDEITSRGEDIPEP